MIIRNILNVAAILFRDHPDAGGQLPPWGGARDTFIFRFALGTQLLVVRWLSQGGFKQVNRDRLRNDVTDMTYVAYATFFDGILSNDRKLLEVYEEVRFFLSNVFPAKGPSIAQ